MTFEEMKSLPDDKQKEIISRIKSVRTNYKVVNYSGIYGVGAPKLARESGLPLKDARKLLEDYWERNWSVKVIAKEQYIKTLRDGSLWLKNPVSGFYHSLRFEKDIFSTLNQSTGVYCFDTFVAYCVQLGVEIPMQYHDEILVECDDDEQSINDTKERLQNAITKTNEKVKLNVKLSIDFQAGHDYASVH